MDVFEATETARAIRYLKDDPVPTELADRPHGPVNRRPVDEVIH